jgi:hypothetical protein
MLAVGISAGHGLVDKSLVQARSNTVDIYRAGSMQVKIFSRR